MGQGRYHAIVFGCLEPDIDVTANGYTDMDPAIGRIIEGCEAGHGVKFETAYEATPQYLGVVLSVSDPVLARQAKVDPMPDREVATLDTFVDWCRSLAPEGSRARQAWEDFRQRAGEVGRTIPAGQVLHVADWD